MDALKLVGGAVVAGIWKVAAVVLAVLLLVVITCAGTGWWLAAAARDQALASLKTEQGAAAALRASIGVQNEAVESMQRATAQAQARGAAARAAAVAAGRRYDAAQAKLAGARAATCDDAMPYVNQLLKDMK
jgi:predicted negative regulator of RcsB-dependent stress response